MFAPAPSPLPVPPHDPVDKVAKLGFEALSNRKRKVRDDDEDGDGAGNKRSVRRQDDGGAVEADILSDVAIQKALLAGYTIPEEVEGFKSLLPVRVLSVTRAMIDLALKLNAKMLQAVSVHGEPVILKLTNQREVEVLRHLHANQSMKHTRVIPLLDIVDGRLLVLPLCIPLSQFLVFDASVGDAELLALQFLEGVAYLQHSSVAHLDLKPGNIVVQRDLESKNIDLNIIDFDISVFTDAEVTVSGSSGTDGWRAPEVLAGKPYNPLLADRWSCGRVLVFFLERMKPSPVRETMRLCSRQLMDPDPVLRPCVEDVVSLCLQGMGGMLTTTIPFCVSPAPRPKHGRLPKEVEPQAQASTPVF